MQNSLSTSRRAAITVAAVVQLLAVPAFAAPSEDALVRTTPVSTRGIDLGSAEGQSLLRHRIERAARKVCGVFDQPMASLSDDYMACHEHAVATAAAQLQVMTARAATRGAEILADASSSIR